VFANVDDDTKEEVSMLSQQAMATAGGVDSSNVGINLTAGSLIITAKVTPPGGWSQRKFDDSVKTNLLSEERRQEMELMLIETDGLKEASEGDMVFEAIKGERSDAEVSTTAAPQSTSLRGSEPESPTMAPEAGVETSSAVSWSLLLAFAMPLIGVCQLS